MAAADPIKIPLPCPKCQRDDVRLHIQSATVLTLQCESCAHEWSMERAMLPAHLREKLEHRVG